MHASTSILHRKNNSNTYTNIRVHVSCQAEHRYIDTYLSIYLNKFSHQPSFPTVILQKCTPSTSPSTDIVQQHQSMHTTYLVFVWIGGRSRHGKPPARKQMRYINLKHTHVVSDTYIVLSLCVVCMHARKLPESSTQMFLIK